MSAVSEAEAADAVLVPGAAIICPQCGTAQSLPEMHGADLAVCCRCGGALAKGPGARLDILLALTLGALLIYVPALTLPLLHVEFQGHHRSDVVATGATWLVTQGFWALGTAVFFFTVIAPPLWLGTLAVVLAILLSGRRPAWTGPLLRLAETLRPWAMPEIFLVGGFVAYTRLKMLITTDIGLGAWAFLAFGIMVLAIDIIINRPALWDCVMPSHPLPRNASFSCHSCGMPMAGDDTADEKEFRCPRCHARVARRKNAAVARCTALVIASYILYIPANLLPIMTIHEYGGPDQNTILSGVAELIQYNMWPLAMLVFSASILVPLLKLLGLTWCLASTARSSSMALPARTRLVRVVTIIGRWSNIDVFMLSILAGLVEFGQITQVDAEPGAVAFAAVVILTMFASHAFDPRLMWDVAEEIPA